MRYAEGMLTTLIALKALELENRCAYCFQWVGASLQSRLALGPCAWVTNTNPF